jgi:hypothetical protein
MKKNDTRELLLITKAAANWDADFDKRVDELMELVNKLDTLDCVSQCVEVMDVYHNNSLQEPARSRSRKRKPNFSKQKPFEFLAFSN